MNSAANTEVAPVEYDPVYLHSRKEAIVIFCVWAASFAWAVPYCYFNGYVENFDPATFSTVMGVPSWVFYGIGAPWLVADVITIWLCFFYIKNDDLGEEGGIDAGPAEQSSSDAGKGAQQ
jgi:hypothetical protein